MLILYDQMIQEIKINAARKNRLSSLLPNKESSMEQADYRPITLPKAENNPLARILANCAS
jgi:hypothetical protein